jgi:hypothetical protein
MMEDINFSAVVRQQVANVFALIRERDASFKIPNKTPLGIVSQEPVPMAGGGIQQLQGVMPGMEIAGAVGEKLKFDGANVPSDQFFSHIRLMIQQVGCNLGLPLILMLMDASETNFSGWRGAFDQAKLGFQHNQRWHRNRLCRPTYIWKVRQFIAKDRAIRKAFEKIGNDIFRHRWNMPSWPYVNPLQDTQADALAVEKRLTSPRRMAAKHNIEFIDLTDEVIEDNEYSIMKAIAASQRVQKKTGQPVDFHEFLFINNAAPIKTTASEPAPVDAAGNPIKTPPAAPYAPQPGQPPMPAGQPPPKSADGDEDDDELDDEGNPKKRDEEDEDEDE